MTTDKRQIPIDDTEPRQRAWGAQAAHVPPGKDVSDLGHGEGGEPRVGAGFAGTTAPSADTKAAASVRAEEPAAVEGPSNEDLAQRCDELSDQLLRQRAEFDNFRRRASREVVEARARAEADLLGQFLPVLDNLERALDAAEHHDEGKVLGGVRLTKNLFVDLLRGIGVDEIDTVGTQFDPRVHDAVMTQPSEQAEGVITARLERGYRQGERVLRPAKVAVSSGPNAESVPGSDHESGAAGLHGIGR